MTREVAMPINRAHALRYLAVIVLTLSFLFPLC
jgi:hypothetical protein